MAWPSSAQTAGSYPLQTQPLLARWEAFQGLQPPQLDDDVGRLIINSLAIELEAKHSRCRLQLSLFTLCARTR